MASPFQFGKIVSATGFVNREEDKKRLKQNFESGINTIIISPRRWGKSSLVKEAARLTLDKELRFCFIDMFSVRSEEKFYEIFARELIKCTSTKSEDWLNAGKDFFKKIIPKFSFGVSPEQDFSLSIDWKEAEKYKEEILDLPQVIALKKKIRIVVCIDEFQNLRNFNNADEFEKSLRASWQHHSKVSYCLYGSKRHMMTELFHQQERPFYRFGEIIMLGKIDRKHWAKYLASSFQKEQMTITKVQAEKIADLMKCHSYYVQQLAHMVWSIADKIVTDDHIDSSVEDLLRFNEGFYQREVEILSNTQLNLLQAIAEGARQLTSVESMQKYQLGTPRNVSKNREILEKADMIDVSGRQIEFLDPAFELWFKKVFLKKNS